MSDAITKVVVVGRDAALWLTALTLRRALHASGVKVFAVELPSRLRPGQVHSSLPALEALHQRIGIDEAALLRGTGGSQVLGWNVVVPGLRPFFLAHGAYGSPIGGDLFLPFWVRARANGLDIPFDEFSPTAMAARFNRILLPDAETDSFGRADYAYHLPAAAYASALKALAGQSGVAIVEATEVGVSVDGEGGVAAVTANGEHIDGQLFIDCSGDNCLPAGRAAARAENPVFDRVVTGSAPPFSTTPPFAEIRVHPAGAMTLQSCRAGTDVRFAFDSAGLTDNAAFDAASALAGTALGDAKVGSIPVAQESEPWTGNCISIGGAGDRSGPFDFDLHAVQLALVHLLSLFPAGREFDSERDEYNRIMGSSLARLRGVGRLFDALVPLPTPAWRKASQIARTDGVTAHRIALFQARGEIPPLEDESLPLDFFQALCIGMGVIPRSWSPAADLVPLEQVRDDFRRMLSFIRRKVEGLPQV